jgi:S1-C subfamily serine protease
VRGGKDVKLAVALEVAPETPRDEILIQARSPFMGIKIANISPALAEELRLDPSAGGVAVVEVANGSFAQQYGFQRGDVILEVNERKIERTRDLDTAVKQPSRLWLITIARGAQKLTLRVQ